MNFNKFFDKKLIYAYIIILFSIILYNISFKPFIGYDCYYTLGVIRHNFSLMMEDILVNVHPPLYYLMLKTFICIFNPLNNGELLFLSKIFSFVPLVFLLILNFTKIKKVFGWNVSFIFALLLVSSMEILYFSTVVRMYSWALLFITIQLVFAYDLIYGKDKKLSWIVFTLSGIFAAYTHYFSAAITIIIYFSILVYLQRKQIKIWLIAAFVSVIAYLPWIGAFLTQFSTVRENYWVSPITIPTLFEYYKFIFEPMDNYLGIIISVLFFACLIYIIYLNFKNKEFKNDKNKFAILLISIIFLTILLGIILSVLIRPIFVSRYMLPAFGGLLLGFSILFENTRVNEKVYGIILCIIIIFSICGVIGFCQQTDMDYNQTMSNQQLFNSINKTDVVVFNDSLSLLRYSPYINSDNICYGEFNSVVNEYNNSTIVFFDKHNNIKDVNCPVSKIGEVNQDNVYVNKR